MSMHEGQTAFILSISGYMRIRLAIAGKIVMLGSACAGKINFG